MQQSAEAMAIVKSLFDSYNGEIEISSNSIGIKSTNQFIIEENEPGIDGTFHLVEKKRRIPTHLKCVFFEDQIVIDYAEMSGEARGGGGMTVKELNLALLERILKLFNFVQKRKGSYEQLSFLNQAGSVL